MKMMSTELISEYGNEPSGSIKLKNCEWFSIDSFIPLLDSRKYYTQKVIHPFLVAVLCAHNIAM
jgi:hypothetical protein